MLCGHQPSQIRRLEAHSEPQPCSQLIIRGLKAQPLTPCKQMGMKSIPGRSRVGVRLPHTLTSTALKKSIRNLYEALEIGALQAHASHLLPFSSAFPSNPSLLTQSKLKSLPSQ